jgi:hypothetical protein
MLTTYFHNLLQLFKFIPYYSYNKMRVCVPEPFVAVVNSEYKDRYWTF